jgi:cAMP-specific phosphodiesterase 4
MLNIFVHACDISNPLLNFESYMNWSFLLAQEFNDQTLKEASKGLEVTGFLKYKDLPTYYNGQTFFASNWSSLIVEQMVFPLWKPIGDLFPQLKYLPD